LTNWKLLCPIARGQSALTHWRTSQRAQPASTFNKSCTYCPLPII